MSDFTLVVRVSGWKEGNPANLEEGPVFFLEGSLGETYGQVKRIQPEDILKKVSEVEEIELSELKFLERSDGLVNSVVLDKNDEILYKVIDVFNSQEM